MGWLTSIVGGVGGFLVGGPIGAVAGATLGAAIDSDDSSSSSSSSSSSQSSDYAIKERKQERKRLIKNLIITNRQNKCAELGNKINKSGKYGNTSTVLSNKWNSMSLECPSVDEGLILLSDINSLFDKSLPKTNRISSNFEPAGQASDKIVKHVEIKFGVMNGINLDLSYIRGDDTFINEIIKPIENKIKQKQ